MKYCAAAAGALGLTTTDLIKLEKALATSTDDGGVQVVWLNGAACTGCTVSFANTATYSSVQDLLVPWTKALPHVVAAASPLTTAQVVAAIGGGFLTDTAANGPLDLVFMETLSSSVGYVAKLAAESAKTTGNYVLCIEGAIQTESNGDYCRIGNGTTSSSTATISFADEVLDFATNANCLAVLAVGTCASFGGIPAAKGSVTGARGLVSTGKISGGYKTTDTTGYWDYLYGKTTGAIASIRLLTVGAHITAPVTATLSGGGGSGTVTITMNTGANPNTAIATITATGSGYTSAPSVIFAGGGADLLKVLPTADVKLATTIDNTAWTSLLRKTVCVSGCPPHPDWIVGTIVYILTYLEPPLMDKYHRPVDYYQQYQCTNCIWQTNNPGKDNAATPKDLLDIDNGNQSAWSKGKPSRGNSPRLYKYKYNSAYEGCIGILGCKGRKTKADCSFRRWNADTLNKGGVAFCVQTRAGCHGCTEPRYPDGWGKFFSYR